MIPYYYRKRARKSQPKSGAIFFREMREEKRRAIGSRGRGANCAPPAAEITLWYYYDYFLGFLVFFELLAFHPQNHIEDFESGIFHAIFCLNVRHELFELFFMIDNNIAGILQ